MLLRLITLFDLEHSELSLARQNQRGAGFTISKGIIRAYIKPQRVKVQYHILSL